MVKDQGGTSQGGASKVKKKVSFIEPTPLHYGKKHDSSNFYHFNAIYHKNRKHEGFKEKHVALHAKTTTPKARNVGKSLGKNSKDCRYKPRNKNAHELNGKPKTKDLVMENQVLRSRLDKMEKTLKRMENILLGQNEHNLGLGVQKPSNGHRGLGYKPKAKRGVPSYHRVPYLSLIHI